MNEHIDVRRRTYLCGSQWPTRESNSLARHATLVAWAERKRARPAIKG